MPSALRLVLEHVDERRADDLALRLRIGDAGEPIEEQPRGVDADERQLQPLEARLDLGRSSWRMTPLSTKMQVRRSPIARWTIMRRDRGVDAAAQAEHDPAVADLLADPRRRFLDERAHRPVAGAAADVEREMAQHVGAVLGVRDLGMKQQP